MAGSSGHPASFMSLLRMYHEKKPTIETWRLDLERYYKEYMNGVQRKITRDLRRRSQTRELADQLTSHGGENSWPWGLSELDDEQKWLLNTGILSAVGFNLVQFTSLLIFKVCVDVVRPRRADPLPESYIKNPINLLKKALQNIQPRQLRNKGAFIKSGASENIFHVELYATLRDLLSQPFICSSEARVAGQQKRLDLLILKDDNTSYTSFELKVGKVS